MNELKNQIEVIQTIDEATCWLDQKNLDKLLEHFSEDALLKVTEDGKEVVSLSGKPAIREHLISRLEPVDTIFHNNGTHKVDVLSLDQSATSYTTSIVRISQTDPAIVTDEDLVFEDKLIKVNGFWYIVDRTVRIIAKSVH